MPVAGYQCTYTKAELVRIREAKYQRELSHIAKWEAIKIAFANKRRKEV